MNSIQATLQLPEVASSFYWLSRSTHLLNNLLAQIVTHIVCSENNSTPVEDYISACMSCKHLVMLGAHNASVVHVDLIYELLAFYTKFVQHGEYFLDTQFTTEQVEALKSLIEFMVDNNAFMVQSRQVYLKTHSTTPRSGVDPKFTVRLENQHIEDYYAIQIIGGMIVKGYLQHSTLLHKHHNQHFQNLRAQKFKELVLQLRDEMDPEHTHRVTDAFAPVAELCAQYAASLPHEEFERRKRAREDD